MGQQGRTARDHCVCAVCSKLIQRGDPINVISLTGYSIALAHPACRAQWVKERRPVPANTRR